MTGSPFRLLYVCHEPLPSPYTNTEQVVKTAAALSRVGVHVDVVIPRVGSTASAETVMGRVMDFYGLPASSVSNGFRIIERGVPRPIRGTMVRPWHDIRAAGVARAGAYDAVYTRDPFALVTALRAHPRVIFETYRADLNTRARFAPWRRWCYRHAHLRGVIAHSDLTRRTFVAAGFDQDRVITVHNGFAPESMEPQLTKAEARARLDLPLDATLVCYTGHVDRRKGLEVLAEIASRVPEMQFLLVGQMAGRRHVIPSLDAIPNLALRPRVPPAQVAPYLYAADCLIIPPSSRPLHTHGRTVLPMKTFQYLAAGRPILGPDLEDLREVLTPGHDALLVEPDNADAAATALRRIAADAAMRDALSAHAVETSRRYTWAARAERIAAFLERILSV